VNLINFTCPEQPESGCLQAKNLPILQRETRFRESSHTTHLVLNGKILFTQTFEENSVTVYSIVLRNFDFPAMKTFKTPRVKLTSQNGYHLQFSYWLKTRITDPLNGNLMP